MRSSKAKSSTTSETRCGRRISSARPTARSANGSVEERARALIRDFREPDFETLFEIDRECFPPGIAYSRGELAHFLSLSRGCVAVVERGGEIVGFAVGQLHGRTTGHLVTIDVRPGVRREGIGREMLARIENILFGRGAGRIYLEVAAENLPARRFYEKAGYEATSDLPDFYGPGLDAIRMRKTVASYSSFSPGT